MSVLRALRLPLACLGLAVLGPAAGAVAEVVEIKVCAGQAESAHLRTVERAALLLEGRGIRLALVAAGSMSDGLDRLAAGGCDAALTQGDALYLMQAERGMGRLPVVAPLRLYEEFVHLICRRDSMVDGLIGFMRHPEDRSLIVGPAGSGAALTWQSLAGLDARLAAVRTEEIEGDAALDRLGAEGANACLLHVAPLGSAFVSQVGESGPGLRLVPLDIWYLNQAEDMATSFYRSSRIPAETYGSLQRDLDEPAVETVVVGVFLVTRKDWAKAHAQAYGAVREAMMQAAPQIPARTD